MTGHMIFRVEVTQLVSGVRVHVDADEAGECQIVAPGLGLCWRVASAFMAGVVEPEPPESYGERLLRAGLAVDGPPDMGGAG